MATPSAAKLVLLPFLQSWDGQVLKINLVVIPKIPPLDDLVVGSGTSFATANLTLDVHLLPNINLPAPGGAAFRQITSPIRPTAKPVFETFAAELPIDLNPRPAQRNGQVNKYLPLSYRKAVGFTTSANPLCKNGDEYRCSREQRGPATVRPPHIDPPNSIPWGMVIAQLLKISVLGAATGLVREVSLTLEDDELIKDGGFLYFTLSSTSDGSGLLANATNLKIYATAFPALESGNSLALFSPCLLPVTSEIVPFDYSSIFSEIQDYNDGFAKAVHCTQQPTMDPLGETRESSSLSTRPIKETGIRLGWDDEQVTVWLNRQMDPEQPAYDSPLGVAGYRVDARVMGTSTWQSLVLAQGDVKIGGVDLGRQDTELSVSVRPAQLDALIVGLYWIPMFYDAWLGPALSSRDDLQAQLSRLDENTSTFKGVTPGVNLRYGEAYEFRVRFMDTSGGGPSVSDSARIPGPARIASILFQRYIPPGLVIVTRENTNDLDPAQPPAEIGFKRPLLAYPAIACTSATNIASRLIADMPDAQAFRRDPGLPDPDVDRVQIEMQVYTFAQDLDAGNTGFRTVYKTTREFPADTSDELIVPLNWVDIHNVDDIPTDLGVGALTVPRGRQVRLQVTSLCKDDEGPIQYFGGDDVRYSSPVLLLLRADSLNETGLYASALPSDRVNAYFLQLDQPGQLPDTPDVLGRLAAVADLQVRDNTLRAQPGERIVFGCAAVIPHQIGPDGASLTLSTKAILSLRWLVLIRLVIDRDWSWDVFSHNAVTVERDGVSVGGIVKPNALGKEAIIPDAAARKLARARTTLLFIDSIDPLPAPGQFPQELNPDYRVTGDFQGSSTTDPPLALTIRLPITTPPTQVPVIASAGIAMSPYSRADDYSSTNERDKRLWLEFEKPPSDPRDTFFARVLRNVPDVTIFPSTNTDVLDPLPALPIDPEPIRHIVPDEATDYSGLGAMVSVKYSVVMHANYSYG